MLIALAALASSTFTVEPTDDVWVYMHAAPQSSDPYLRAWGIDGRDLALEREDVTATSWSTLKFDLSKAPTGTLKFAKLVLTAPAELDLPKEETEKTPLNVRPAPVTFEEETFTFGDAEKVFPTRGPEAIFGKASPVPTLDGKDFKIEIDLLQGKGFKEYLAKSLATPNKLLGLALTSALDPAAAGDGAIYKVYSRNAEPEKRPKLTLEFE